MKRLSLILLGACVVLAAVAPAEAALCKRCKGMMFTADIGKCRTCGKGTSSGAFELCRTCSSKQGKCEACQAPLGAGVKPVRPVRPPAKPRPPVAPVAPTRPPRKGAGADVICSEGGGFVGPIMQFMAWPDGLWWYRKGIGSRADTSTGKMTAAQRGAFLKGLADAGMYRTESAKMHPNVPSFQIRVSRDGKWTNLRVAQRHKVAAAIRKLIAALAAKGGQDKTPKGEAKAVAISLKVPDTSWRLKPEGVYQVGKEVWVVWQLSKRGRGMGMMVISTRKSTVYIAPTDLPVKQFILGKRWRWKNTEPYTFIATGGEGAFRKKLAAAKKLPWSTTPDGLPSGQKPGAPKPSKPVVKNGLSICAGPAKDVYAPKEAIRLNVTFKNVSKKPIALAGTRFVVWRPSPGFTFLLKDVKSGKVRALREGMNPMIRVPVRLESKTIAPGESLVVNTSINRWAWYVPGAAGKKRPAERRHLGSGLLPSGEYQVTVQCELGKGGGEKAAAWIGRIEANPVSFKVGAKEAAGADKPGGKRIPVVPSRS